MEKFILLISCLGFGFLLRKTSLFNQNSPIVLNNLIIYFFIPILTLYYVPKIDFQLSLFWLSLTPFVVYLSSFLFIKIIKQTIQIDTKTEGAMIMTGGIGSISFVGFPIFEMLYGEEGLAYGIILSLAGTFLVFNTVGLFTGMYYSNAKSSASKILKKIFTFPPFVSFLVALMFTFFNFTYPEWMDNILLKFTSPFSVLALLTIGMQIDLDIPADNINKLIIGQVHKLIIAPVVIYLLMWQIFGMHTLIAKICILGAGIGSMNAISIVAAQMDLNPKLATLMPAIGIPLSVPLLFLIDTILK